MDPQIIEPNFIDFACPHCGQTASFPEPTAGTAQSCPNCVESLVVPRESGQPGGKVPASISTPRLVLRRFHAGDWKGLLEVMSDPQLFELVDAHPMDEESVVHWVETDREARLTHPGQSLCLAIELGNDSKLIGCATIALRDDSHLQAVFSVYIHREFQRQGYGTETVQALAHLGFRGINLHRLSADCDSRNQAAGRMLQKAGLRPEGTFLKNRLVKGQWVDTSYFSILREEFEKGAGASPEIALGTT